MEDFVQVGTDATKIHLCCYPQYSTFSMNIFSFSQRKGIDQDNYVGIYNGSTSLHAHDTKTSDFINFSNVTESNVISWIEQKLTNGQKTKIDDDIQNQINSRHIKEDLSNLPWTS